MELDANDQRRDLTKEQLWEFIEQRNVKIAEMNDRLTKAEARNKKWRRLCL